ncbi:MAG: amidohydrolase family protein [Caulobacteraceae bacterium]
MPQPAARTVERVDVHAHFLPEFYRAALIEAGHDKPDGMPAIPQWDPATALEVMDGLGVRTAFLSVSSPGVHFGDDAKARALARRVNEEGAQLRRDHPERFGYFASLPLPDVEAAVEEAVRALDTLGADGVIIETNQHGVYLGDDRLEPIWAALDDRAAVVLIHPTSPACNCGDRLYAKFPRPMMEFMFETTRSVTDLVTAGVLKRHPRLRVIVPHAGAALPVLLGRIDAMASLAALAGAPPQQTLGEAMRTLHFDLAGMPVPQLLEALLKVADPQKLHYGSDYPFTPANACEQLLNALEQTPLLSETERRGVWRENALRLFPRFRATG